MNSDLRSVGMVDPVLPLFAPQNSSTLIHTHISPKRSSLGASGFGRGLATVGDTFKKDEFGMLQVFVEGSLIKASKPGIREQVGGGGRGTVYGFSKQSRRRLLQKIATLCQDAMPIFVTLTYPSDFPLDAAQWKKHFDKWCKRLHRKYPYAGLIWRLEPQKRGAPHYHCLVYGLAMRLDGEIHSWFHTSWYECVGSGDLKHLRRGVDLRMCQGMAAVRKYVGKYLGKVQAATRIVSADGEVLDWMKVGRWWGVRYAPNLPWSSVVGGHILSTRDAVKLMRYLRRYLHGQGVKYKRSNVDSMTVFVNNPVQWVSNLDRLLN